MSAREVPGYGDHVFRFDFSSESSVWSTEPDTECSVIVPWMKAGTNNCTAGGAVHMRLVLLPLKVF